MHRRISDVYRLSMDYYLIETNLCDDVHLLELSLIVSLNKHM